MSAKVKLDFSFQTDWTRAYASDWYPSEAPFKHSPDMFRREGVSVVELRNVFRFGEVTYDEKCDGPGATWIVEGDDGDGNTIVAEIVVISDAVDVTVRSVKKVRDRKE